MDTAELLKRVRRVEIKSRGLSDRIFSGQYHSAFKGRGMAFSENREYTPGDEIRAINWNVTARMGTPYLKVFEEERELTVFIIADVSGSIDVGTRGATKRDRITELAAIIGFSALGNNDKVGAILFSDRIEQFIPPKKGRSHVLRIIRELLEIQPKGLYLTRPSIGQYFTNRKELQAGADQIFEKVKFGKIRIKISKKYKLVDAKDAHADLEARKLIGPAILIP